MVITNYVRMEDLSDHIQVCMTLSKDQILSEDRLVKEITIHSDEQYGGHWIETDTKTYYFSQNTTLTQVFDMLAEDEDNVGKH